jgi:hypothetical protein
LKGNTGKTTPVGRRLIQRDDGTGFKADHMMNKTS